MRGAIRHRLLDDQRAFFIQVRFYVDRQILRAETLLLLPLSNEHLHHLIDQLAELYDVRLILEPQAARWTAERRSSEHCRELQHLLGRMKESSPDTPNGAADFLECDRVFHLIIATASANRVLRAVVRDVHELLTTSWLLSDLSRDDFAAIYDQHSLIAQAIIDRDGSRAESVMREHLEWAAAKDRTAERELDAAIS